MKAAPEGSHLLSAKRLQHELKGSDEEFASSLRTFRDFAAKVWFPPCLSLGTLLLLEPSTLQVRAGRTCSDIATLTPNARC